MANSTSEISSYHAHVYYEPTTRQSAEHLRENLGDRFEVTLGRWHDSLVGPHTQSMYQVAFAVEQFNQVLPWLMLNRKGLNILVHPNTGNAVADHTEHALWLGNRLPINLEPLENF
ncbi:MAG: 4,5-dioxygenase [Thermosynechococcaceae cyanobacterium MS004]|nr:4,5-dioxygenase [Thermosynechococcaceae cyanobacterium MS004]